MSIKRLVLLTLTVCVQILCFSSANAAAASGGGSHQRLTVKFEELPGAGSQSDFVFAIIRPARANQTVSVDDQSKADALLAVANDWFFEQLITRYKHAPPEELRAKLGPMKKLGIHLTAESSFIIAFDKKNPDRPAGTLWLYYPDANGKIDLQKDLESQNWKLPEPETTRTDYPILSDVASARVDHPVLWSSGVVELKRFALDVQSPRELMVALLLRGEAIDRLGSRPLRTRLGMPAAPAAYALRCNHALIPVYRRLGFQSIPGDARNEANEDYVMMITRDAYVANAVKRLESTKSTGWKFKFKKASPESEAVVVEHMQHPIQISSCRAVFA